MSLTLESGSTSSVMDEEFCGIIASSGSIGAPSPATKSMASVSILGRAVTLTLGGSIHRRIKRASAATHGHQQDPNTKASGRITRRMA